MALDLGLGEGVPEDHQRVRGRGGGLLDRWPSALGGRGRPAAQARPGPLPGPSEAVPDRRGRGPAGRAPSAARAGTGAPARRAAPAECPASPSISGAIHVRPDLVKLLVRRQRLDPPLQVVVGALEAQRLGLVPCRAIGPGQHVQPGQQRPSVPRVAPARHGSIPPGRSRGTAGAARQAQRRPRPRLRGTAAR